MVGAYHKKDKNMSDSQQINDNTEINLLDVYDNKQYNYIDLAVKNRRLRRKKVFDAWLSGKIEKIHNHVQV